VCRSSRPQGEGGYGAVFKAVRHLEGGRGRLVALKFVTPTLDNERVANEAGSLRALRGSQHVVDLLDVVRWGDGLSVLVFPFKDSDDFRDLARNATVEVREEIAGWG
jgi:serine/threonine protein kinase